MLAQLPNGWAAMKTTRGWSKGKKHGDGGDVFSLGGRRRKAPVTLPCIGAQPAPATRKPATPNVRKT